MALARAVIHGADNCSVSLSETVQLLEALCQQKVAFEAPDFLDERHHFLFRRALYKPTQRRDQRSLPNFSATSAPFLTFVKVEPGSFSNPVLQQIMCSVNLDIAPDRTCSCLCKSPQEVLLKAF